MSHYYKTDRTLKENKKDLTFELNDIDIKLTTDSGVFSRDHIDYGTTVLLKNINEKNPKTIIDMGCGYGTIGIYLAKKYPEATIYMYDINERAVELSNQNIKLNNLTNAVAIVSNMFEQNKHKADLIITNPPIRAGKKVIFEIYKQSLNNLKKNGKLILVIQKKQGALSTIKYLETLFDKVEVLDRDKGYWVIASR